MGTTVGGKRLDPAFTEPRLQAKVIGGDKGGGKARPIAFEEMLPPNGLVIDTYELTFRRFGEQLEHTNLAFTTREELQK